MKKEKKNQIENISDIINEEILRGKTESLESHKNIWRNKEISDKIIEAIYKEICEQNFAIKASKALPILIARFELDRTFAAMTFASLEQKLTEKLADFEVGTKIHNKILEGIENINERAVSHFENYILEGHEDSDLAEILIDVKSQLIDYKNTDRDYYKEALLEIQKSIENDIKLIEEKFSIRNKLEQFSKIQDTSDDGKKKHLDLNQENATLFMSYLFDFAEVNCPFTKKAEVIEFLTGYSIKQIVKLPSEFEKQKLEIEDNGEVNKKYFDDMQTIRKCFVKLNLTEIVERIDRDLGN